MCDEVAKLARHSETQASLSAPLLQLVREQMLSRVIVGMVTDFKELNRKILKLSEKKKLLRKHKN